MAKAIVSLVTEKLGLVTRLELEQEVRQVVGVRKEVSKITSTLGFIKAVLDDAEKKQLYDNAVKVWMETLRDIMHDADDVLDEWYTSIFISQQQRKGATGGSRTTNKVISYSSSPFQPAMLRNDIAHRIKNIRGRLDYVAREKDQLNLVQFQSPEDNRLRQLTSSIVGVSEIQGRPHDEAYILNWVLDENSHEETHAPVPVISIVGIGGLGKTTLAQLIFNNEAMTAFFGCKIWVSVSEPFHLERVTKDIIAQASGGNVQSVVGWEALRQRLCSAVKGKRFLLVVDDVWIDNSRDWTLLKRSLDGGARGSRIIITTRSERVAEMVGSYTYMLNILSQDDCWNLFRHIAFQGRSQQELESLEEIGVEIASKCKGVPLAVKTVASLMRFKQTKEEWRTVLQSGIWEMGRGFFPAIVLSYHALPAHLKECFMYTALFPKNTRLEKDQLVKLWMAQGFVGSDGGRELEIIAGAYFDDLAARSFFQDFERDVNGNVTSCKMPDFLYDVAQSLTKDECYIMKTDDIGLSNNKVRHLNAWNIELSSAFIAKNARTLFLRGSTEVLRESFLQSRSLRALDLHGCDITELPEEVQCLLHLRYLDLSVTKLSILPEALCNLCNLQTLKLNSCWGLHKLPEGIGRLSNLRHLEDNYNLEYIPESIGRLSNLQTLHMFILSSASGGCKVEELGHLNCLTGSLLIKGLRKVENVDESKGAHMLKKKDLGSLQLDFGYQRGQEVIEEGEVKRIEGVLEGLQPNANLERLDILNYPGSIFPFWMSCKSLLCNVVTLELKYCRYCNQLPALGYLESLENLVISGFESVEHIGAEFYGVRGDTSFPKLKSLKLERMSEWVDWEIPFPNFRKVLPRLCHLILYICPKLMRLPALGRLESLESISLASFYSLKAMGTEFIGISLCDSGRGEQSKTTGIILSRGDGGEYLNPQEQHTVVFPSLRRLEFTLMKEWEEWNLPLLPKEENVEIMPHLKELRIERCLKLKALPAALGELRSLRELYLSGLCAVKHVGADLVGFSDGRANVVLFPRLTKLELRGFREWVEEQYEETSGIFSIMPCLRELRIVSCPKLKVVPAYMFSHSLRSLVLEGCQQLKVVPSLPPLLEEMELWDDVGAVWRSLMSISCDQAYPNLKSLVINRSPDSSLPQGLRKFTSLRQLRIWGCEFLDLKPEEELRHFPMLQALITCRCPVISERCSREDWTNILSFYIAYNIEISRKDIKFTKRH